MSWNASNPTWRPLTGGCQVASWHFRCVLSQMHWPHQRPQRLPLAWLCAAQSGSFCMLRLKSKPPENWFIFLDPRSQIFFSRFANQGRNSNLQSVTGIVVLYACRLFSPNDQWQYLDNWLLCVPIKPFSKGQLPFIYYGSQSHSELREEVQSRPCDSTTWVWINWK